MVFEILSPSTGSKDKTLKFDLYQRKGIREYWIVDPELKTVNTNILIDGMYIGRNYKDNDVINVHILEGFKVSLIDVFAE